MVLAWQRGQIVCAADSDTREDRAMTESEQHPYPLSAAWERSVLRTLRWILVCNALIAGFVALAIVNAVMDAM